MSSISLEHTRPTPGPDKYFHIPEMLIVGKVVGKIADDGSFKFDVLNGGYGGQYCGENNSVIIRKEHQIKPITLMWLDTEKMPPDLKSEWYL